MESQEYFIKIWAVDGNMFFDEESGMPALNLIVSGPIDHNKTRTATCIYNTEEQALKDKFEIDKSFEPVIKPLVFDPDDLED